MAKQKYVIRQISALGIISASKGENGDRRFFFDATDTSKEYLVEETKQDDCPMFYQAMRLLYGEGFHAELDCDKLKDADILRAIGKDINKFDDVEIEWKDNLRYDPKKGAAPVKSNFHFVTQLFSKDELPVGSIVIVDDLYAVTPVKYKTADGTEPDEDLSAYDTNLSSKKILYIDKDFWGDYNYVGFNISMYSDELPVSYGSHGGVRIYKAK